ERRAWILPSLYLIVLGSTLAALLTSLLSTREIWWGKFVAALLFQIFLLISAVPVLALAFAFGGVGWRELGIATLTTLVVAASLSAVGLISSAYFRRTIHATAVTYAVVTILTAVTGIVAFG